MSKERRIVPVNVTEAAKKSQEGRKGRISSWLLNHGFGATAAGVLSIAAYMAIFGGSAAAVVTAPLFVSVAGAVAVVGASLLATGVLKRITEA